MSKWIDLETDASTGKPYLWKCDECGEEVETKWNYCPECGDPKTQKGENINTFVKALEAEHKKLRDMQKAQPHTYRGVTLNDVMMYFDSLAENEDAWTEFCACLECRGWWLYHIRSATDKNVGTTDARQDFMDIVYAELHSDGDNNRANRIIDAADEYAESAKLGTNLTKEYARAVRNWLVNYQVKCADLAGRYTPYEVLGWIVSDWRKENGIW